MVKTYLTRRRLLLTSASVSGITVTGAGYQHTALRHDKERYEPEGTIVEHSGHHTHIVISGPTGPKIPVVVIDTGIGSWSLDWYKFQRQFQGKATIVTYDRAGYGWSDTRPESRTVDILARECAETLQKTSLTGPYLLIGHSFGGYISRMLATDYLDDVAGIVFADAIHEDMFVSNSPLKQEYTDVDPLTRSLPALSTVGGIRLLTGLRETDAPMVPPYVKDLPQDLRAQYLSVGYQPSFFKTMIEEMQLIEASSEAVRATGSLGDVPLTAITHGQSVYPTEDPTGAEIESLWKKTQPMNAALSTQGELLIATDSGHNIHHDDPDLLYEVVESHLNRL